MKVGCAAVILDVDGTLVDSNEAHARAWVDAFAESGIAVGADRVRRAIGMGGDKLMPAVAHVDADSELGKAVAERRRVIFRDRYMTDVKPFAGTRDLVRRFVDDGIVVAVASSARAEELGPLLDIAGVGRLITEQTSADDAERSKPDPDIVVAALARTGCDADDAVMIGDTPYDMQAARHAGIVPIGFECGGWSRQALKGALEVYRGPADLLAHYGDSLIRTLAPPVRASEIHVPRG